eukprot:TRINITY_DN23274_c0_g1_i2.p1 TRINITY_DN23274_c0_g1~~TRINITY_DN23274_c0_g1_i2.p1  ORF type:complete len:160 (+),score=31.80 TRINITY_DN23274_c0_g1_i2:22-480(+)
MGQGFSSFLAGITGPGRPELEAKEEETTTASRYKPLQKHPELFQAEILTSWVAPELISIVEACEKVPTGTKPEDISPQLRIEANDIFSFPCFSSQFILLFNDEIENFYATGIPARRPNSMNNYGVIVNEIGMRPMITEFQQLGVWHQLLRSN